jgi:hypothetical protein
LYVGGILVVLAAAAAFGLPRPTRAPLKAVLAS